MIMIDEERAELEYTDEVEADPLDALESEERQVHLTTDKEYEERIQRLRLNT